MKLELVDLGLNDVKIINNFECPKALLIGIHLLLFDKVTNQSVATLNFKKDSTVEENLPIKFTVLLLFEFFNENITDTSIYLLVTFDKCSG